MRKTPVTSAFSAICLAALLTGCGSSGIGDILGGGRDTGSQTDPYRDNVTDVRGTVERVDTRNRMIVVDGESYRNDSRPSRVKFGNRLEPLRLDVTLRTVRSFRSTTMMS